MLVAVVVSTRLKTGFRCERHRVEVVPLSGDSISSRCYVVRRKWEFSQQPYPRNEATCGHQVLKKRCCTVVVNFLKFEDSGR